MAKKSYNDRMIYFHMAQGVFIGFYLGICFMIEPIQIEVLLGMVMFGVYFLLDRGFRSLYETLDDEIKENRKMIAALSKPAAKKKTAAKKTTAKKKTAAKKKK